MSSSSEGGVSRERSPSSWEVEAKLNLHNMLIASIVSWYHGVGKGSTVAMTWWTA